MFKIAVCIPTIGTINAKTVRSLMEMMNLPYEFIPIFRYGAYVSENRENLVKCARKVKATHLLFIDHDMKFFNITIDLLIKHDKDIVTAFYNYRTLPITPMVKMFGENSTVLLPKTKDIPDEMFKVAGIGLGCSLIKMSVFDKLEAPYFPMLYDDKGSVIRSEDIGFCEKARDAGYDIWCDPSLQIKHVGDYEY